MQTILFTDIEGSTRLWEERGATMAAALERHDAILATGIEEGGGEVLKTTGDGFIATFESPSSAVAAVLRIQRALSTESWGATGPLRVRMGLHSGDTERRGDDHFGPAMNRTARIMAAGHGGQVLLSMAVADVIAGDLPPEVTLRDLGSHRLRDLTQTEHLYQLVAADLPSDFPAPRTLEAAANNLPPQPTEFLGRQHELAAAGALLDAPNTRLLTITGPGGVGKTRLALQLAAGRTAQFPDGVFFVDVSAARDADAVFAATVAALALPVMGGGSPLATLKSRLRDRRLLLLLDNFEQAIAAAPGVSELLQSVPDIKVLITSRETLRVRAELVFPLPPLALPDPASPARGMAGSEAVRFFEERARAVRPDFALTDENGPAVAAICAALDGLPLALELAAARLNLFTPGDLLRRLRQRLDVLGDRGRDLPDRQRTLRGAIEWSYELLEPAERSVFELMSVFASTTLEALEAVAGQSSATIGDVLGPLSSLVDKSLVQARDDRGSQRFSMLRVVSEYAAERLADTPTARDAVREAHARYVASFGRVHEATSREAGRDDALTALEAELGNLRIAWRFWLERGDLDQLLALTDALWALHAARGWYHAALEFTREILATLERSGRSAEFVAEELMLRTSLARALMAVGGYNVEVEHAFTRALELARADGETALEFPVLRALASIYMQRTSWDEAAAIGRQLLALGEASHNQLMLAEGHYVVGVNTAFSQPSEAIDELNEAITLFGPATPNAERFGLGPNSAVLAHTASALVLWESGALDQATRHMADALQLARTLDHPYTLAYSLYHSGYLEVQRSRYEECRAYAYELAELSAAHQYALWATLANLLEGVAISALGDTEAGLAMTETAVDLYQGLTPPPVFWTFVLMLRAAVHGRAGKPERALALLDEARGTSGPIEVDSPPLAVMTANIMRTLPDPDWPAIEARYLGAIEAGPPMGLRLVALNAATGLVTLRRQLGRTPDGSEELEAVYATFTEGFKERDLIAARTALEA